MDVPSHDEVLDKIDAFLARHEMAPSRLGRDALGEPQFVSQLRKGRQPNLTTLSKLFDFMGGQDRIVLGRESIPDGNLSHRLNAGAR